MNRVLNSLRSLDLRFDDAGNERAFQKTLERSLAFRFCIGEVIILSFSALSLTQPEEDEAKAEHRDARNVAALAWLCSPIFNIVFLIMGISWLRCNCCLCTNWEVAVAIIHAVRNALFPWVQPWVTATMFGFDPAEVWSGDMRSNEGDVALGIDFAITAICLCFPMRVCWKWIPAVASVLSFCTCTLVVGSPFPEAVPSRLILIAVLSGMALAGAWFSEQVARMKFVAEGQVKRKSQELELQHISNARILNALTDALICLRSDFRIFENDQRFSALLLCSNQDSIVGSSFCEYLATDEDRRRFTESLTERVSGGDQGMVQVTLRDHYGRRFPVYAYHANFFDDGGECGHTVAIVEAQEREFSFAEASVLPLEPQPEYHAPDDNQSSNSGTVLSASVERNPEGEVAIWVDVDSGNFPMLQCSAGFTVFGPMAPCTPFLDLIVDRTDSKQKMPEWFWATMETVTANLDNIARPWWQNDPIKLHLINQAHGPIEFSTNCFIDVQTPVPEDLATRNVVRLLFYDIRCKQRRSGSKLKETRQVNTQRYRLSYSNAEKHRLSL